MNYYLVAVVLVHWCSYAEAACKYSQSPATAILAMDENCPNGNICFVDNQCQPVQTFPSSTSVFKNATGIGDLRNYPNSSIQVFGNKGPIFDMSQMSLPGEIQDLWIDSVENFDLKSLPKNKMKNVHSLRVRLCNLKSYRNEDIPESVNFLDFQYNDLTDISNPPEALTKLDLSSNPRLSQLVGLNFTSLQYVSLCHNLRLTTISHVSFGKNIVHFCCYSCSITNFTLTEESYENLNAITAAGTCNANSNLGCVVLGDSRSVVDKTSCFSIGGVVKTLWNTSAWSACVIPGMNPIFVPTTSPFQRVLPQLPNSHQVRYSFGIALSNLLDTAVIVGVVLGVLVLLFGIGLFFWCRRRNGDQNANYSLVETPRQTNQTTKSKTKTQPLTAESYISDADDAGYNLAPIRPVRLELVDLAADKRLSSGAYGEVWHGTYGKREVAIKRIKDKSIRHVQKFADEILLLSRIDCPYIVKLVGASWERPLDLECVVEFMDMGDLYSYLAKTTSETFTWEEKFISIECVVRGLIYLHTFEPPIIHRDLKSRNILLDSTKGTKLTDFGESREVDDDTLTNNIGTFQWMAPEVMMQTSYSVAADVYSFGVVLTEYSTHRSPYSDKINPATKKPYTQQYLTSMVLKGEIQPTIDTTNTPLWLQELTLRCLSPNPEDRPSTMEIQRIVRAGM